MELLLAIGIGVLVACGVWLLLRPRIFSVLLGLSFLSYAVNLLLLASGRLVVGSAPLADVAQREYPDPLPQALILTAIVIGFGMTAYLVVLSLRAQREAGSDDVNLEAGDVPPEERAP